MPEIEKLESMVAYQSGAVVSRTLINKKKGTITLFSFDKGEELSEHTTPYDAFVYVLDGEVKITLGGDPNNLKKGESVIMPAEIPHALKAISKFKMLLVMIKE
jgi:quercetin dioxygenase-like cupin family protein